MLYLFLLKISAILSSFNLRSVFSPLPLWFIVCVFFGSLFMCSGVSHALDVNGNDKLKIEGNLTITGSSTMCPLIKAIGDRFHSLYPKVILDVQCGGSARGIKDVREGKSKIGMVSRALTDKEQDLFGFTIARDGVSIIINKNNPVVTLSNKQIFDIFTGKITNWKQAGGNDANISVVLKTRRGASTELFYDYFKFSNDMLTGKFIDGDNSVVINAVTTNPNAISYVSSGEAQRKGQAGDAVKIIPVDNIMPTNRNIITMNYPISRALSLVTKALPSGLEKEFINYCLSSAVNNIIVQYDFVPYEE